MTATKGFRASALPPSTLCAPLFARHSRQITTQKSVFSESGDRREVLPPLCWIKLKPVSGMTFP